MATDKDRAPDETAAAAEVQKRVDVETEQGFRGVSADPTPNEHYTVEGVTAGKPTPETDDGAAEAARKHAQSVERGDQGVI